MCSGNTKLKVLVCLLILFLPLIKAEEPEVVEDLEDKNKTNWDWNKTKESLKEYNLVLKEFLFRYGAIILLVFIIFLMIYIEKKRKSKRKIYKSKNLCSGIMAKIRRKLGFKNPCDYLIPVKEPDGLKRRGKI